MPLSNLPPIDAHSDHNLGKITGLAIDKEIHIAYKPKMNGVIKMCSLQFPKRAQAGVRYSITNLDAYIESNMICFYNILEACRHYPVEHLVYASSSSVYAFYNIGKPNPENLLDFVQILSEELVRAGVLPAEVCPMV